MARFGFVVPTLLSSMLIAASSHAQQPKVREPSAKTPTVAQIGAAASATERTWVKLCEKAASLKEEKKDVYVCLTHYEQLGGDGKVLVSAALRQLEGQDKQAFMVMVPLGMLLQTDLRADIYPKDAWEKAHRNEKLDESKLMTISLLYTLCHPAGCTAEVEATPGILASLKSSGGFIVRAISEAGSSVVFPIPLKGFAEALNGEPRKPSMPWGDFRPLKRCDKGFWPGCKLP